MSLPKFKPIGPTAYPPEQDTLVWDGSCGFCAYWVRRWQLLTAGKLHFAPYQEVASHFKDIDIQHFKEASRLIEASGVVHSGPQSAYQSLALAGEYTFLARWYSHYRWFRAISDLLYYGVASRRNTMWRLTRVLFGSNPEEPRPFWVIYLSVLAYALYQLL